MEYNFNNGIITLGFGSFSEEEQQEFFGEWESLGAIIEDAAQGAQSPWGCPWYYNDNFQYKTKVGHFDMHECALAYWTSVRDEVLGFRDEDLEACEEDEDKIAKINKMFDRMENAPFDPELLNLETEDEE